MFHIFITNRVGDVRLGSLGKVVEATRRRSATTRGASCRAARWARCGCAATRWRSSTGSSTSKSKQTFRGDWCVSADKFQQDEDGYFYFCGRGDDMLKVGGKWLSPVEVENALLQHPAVREAAVVSFKDADGLDKPRAFVALHPGQAGNEALAEALKRHVRRRCRPSRRPARSLPRRAARGATAARC